MDITKKELLEAIVSFQKRKRRLGRTSNSEHKTNSQSSFPFSRSAKKEKSNPETQNSEIYNA